MKIKWNSYRLHIYPFSQWLWHGYTFFDQPKTLLNGDARDEMEILFFYTLESDEMKMEPEMKMVKKWNIEPERKMVKKIYENHKVDGKKMVKLLSKYIHSSKQSNWFKILSIKLYWFKSKLIIYISTFFQLHTCSLYTMVDFGSLTTFYSWK